MRKLLLYFHTIRYLKFKQLWYRVWLKVRAPKVDEKIDVAVGELIDWQVPIAKVISYQEDSSGVIRKFTFLNQTAEQGEFIDWSYSQYGKLWLYNLHYFDFLNQGDKGLSDASGLTLIHDWIDNNPPGDGDGWEPYPISLRVVNWIKWHLAGNTLDSRAISSLATQVCWLSQRIEHHILANHLFANCKALTIAGLFFAGADADRWWKQGSLLLQQELCEQFLEDGGHYERSPMYHAILLEDILDILNALTSSQRTVESLTEDMLRDRLPSIIDWLRILNHPDGAISFFNDAAFNIAPDMQALRDYAVRLAVCAYNSDQSGIGQGHTGSGMQVEHLVSSGYVRVAAGAWCSIIDVAPVGPDYQPGHTHADTLSFELSINNERLLVNGGTSTYIPGELRSIQRSTAMHNTVEVNQQNSSEVWGGFRVARRAIPYDVSATKSSDGVLVSAAHDGYQRLSPSVVHRRQWHINSERVVIVDELIGDFASGVARFLLHPETEVLDAGACLRTASGSIVRVSCLGGSPEIIPSVWYPQFGQSLQTHCIEVKMSPGVVNEMEFTIDLDRV